MFEKRFNLAFLRKDIEKKMDIFMEMRKKNW